MQRDGSVTFDKISFTKPGTYTYTITENKANLNSNFDVEPLTITKNCYSNRRKCGFKRKCELRI